MVAICPRCRTMVEVEVTGEDEKVTYARCPKCRCVWVEWKDDEDFANYPYPSGDPNR